MPELPEVETIARGLRRAVSGKTIVQASVVLPKVVLPEPKRFVREIQGERIATVGRRGKFVVVSLQSGRSLVVHLRMTGRLIVQPAGALAGFLSVNPATSLKFPPSSAVVGSVMFCGLAA